MNLSQQPALAEFFVKFRDISTWRDLRGRARRHHVTSFAVKGGAEQRRNDRKRPCVARHEADGKPPPRLDIEGRSELEPPSPDLQSGTRGVVFLNGHSELGQQSAFWYIGTSLGDTSDLTGYVKHIQNRLTLTKRDNPRNPPCSTYRSARNSRMKIFPTNHPTFRTSSSTSHISCTPSLKNTTLYSTNPRRFSNIAVGSTARSARCGVIR